MNINTFNANEYLENQNFSESLNKYDKNFLIEILKYIYTSNIENYLITNYGVNSIFNLKLQCIMHEYINYLESRNKKLEIKTINKTKSWFTKKYKSLTNYTFNKYDLYNNCQMPDYERNKANMVDIIPVDYYIDLLNRNKISRIIMSQSTESEDVIIDELFNIIVEFKEYIIKKRYGVNSEKLDLNSPDDNMLFKVAIFSTEIYANEYFSNLVEKLKKKYNITDKDINDIGLINNNKYSPLYAEHKNFDIFELDSKISKKLYKKLDKFGIRHYLDSYGYQYNDIKQYYLDFIGQEYLEYIKSNKSNNKKITQKDIDTYDEWIADRFLKLNKYNFNSEDVSHILPMYFYLESKDDSETFELNHSHKIMLEIFNRYGLIERALEATSNEPTPEHFFNIIDDLCDNCMKYCISKKYNIKINEINNMEEYSIDPFDVLYYTHNYLNANL